MGGNFEKPNENPLFLTSLVYIGFLNWLQPSRLSGYVSPDSANPAPRVLIPTPKGDSSIP